MSSILTPVPGSAAKPRIPAPHAADLRWFFRTGGFDPFLRSATAAAIDWLETYGRTARPCTRCGGDLERWEGGMGFVDARTGKAPQAEDPTYPAPIGDRICPTCHGRGWWLSPGRSNAKRAVSARPSRQCPPPDPVLFDARPRSVRTHNHATRLAIDEAVIARRGLVARRLEAVEAAGFEGTAERVFGAYYGPDGGTLTALWEFTPAGRKMLRNNPHRLPPRQFFQNERSAQELSPTATRRELFKAADEQAALLFETMCRVWNSVVPYEKKAV